MHKVSPSIFVTTLTMGCHDVTILEGCSQLITADDRHLNTLVGKCCIALLEKQDSMGGSFLIYMIE